MSAIASDRADTAKGRLRPMREDDLEAVMEIEHRAYPFPWTHGIFRDCLRADYPAWILHEDGRILGSGGPSVAADASHVDRKSAGVGTRWSVRVDPGGPRNIKNK